MSMKRLTDERIAALIDMVPLNEMPSTIVDIKSALVELQERRKADAEPVAWLHANNAIGIPAITVSKKVADDWYQNGLNAQPLYAAPQPAPIAPDLSGIDMTNIFEDEELEMMSHGNNPRSNAYRELLAFRKAMGSQEFPDLKSEKSSPPVTKFDNEYIRTRLDVFDDTHELAGWLLEEADRYHEAQLFADEYNLREAATSLCEMYADLKDFGNELIRLQERQKTVPVAPDEMTVEAAYPEVQTGWNDARNYVAGWNACRAAMLATAPKPEDAK